MKDLKEKTGKTSGEVLFSPPAIPAWANNPLRKHEAASMPAGCGKPPSVVTHPALRQFLYNSVP